MNNDEMHSTMQFILEQQAQFAVNIQKLQEGQLRAEERFAKLEDSLAKLEGSLERMVNLIEAIAHAQAQTEVNLARTDERLNNLVSAQARTDERLNTLISMFERHLYENRNGAS
jgi:septal ring factor EnvC (AmiA/AmiB activator)